MSNPLFSQITDIVCTRRYELDPEQFGGLSVTVWGECSLNAGQCGDAYYLLSVYFSVDNYGARDFLTGIPFGTAEMDKRKLNASIDDWVNVVLHEDEGNFSVLVQEFLEKEEMWEDFLSTKLQGNVTDSDDTE